MHDRGEVSSDVAVPATLSDSYGASIRPGSHLAVQRKLYLRGGKRFFDFVASAIGLVLLAPILVGIGILVKSSSRGPVLFRQQRVGKDGKPFWILKFRSMMDGAERAGVGITPNSDPRVTRPGVLLRKWKLDELPQLWNVLVGEMSLVGPRPELPSYVLGYTIEQKEVLKVRPGITDPASVRYRDEGSVLERSSDPELLYRKKILPEKLALNLQYLKDISFARDLSLVLGTLRSVMRSSEAKKQA